MLAEIKDNQEATKTGQKELRHGIEDSQKKIKGALAMLERNQQLMKNDPQSEIKFRQLESKIALQHKIQMCRRMWNYSSKCPDWFGVQIKEGSSNLADRQSFPGYGEEPTLELI